MDSAKVAVGSREMAAELSDNARKIGRNGEPWCI